MLSFMFAKANIVSIIGIRKTNMLLREVISAVSELDKKQLEYLSIAIMPELYKRQAQKNDYLEQLKISLKETKVKKTTI